MDVGVYAYPPGDPLLIDKIVNEFLSQGKFDKLRKECMSDADTKPAYQNLQQRVETTVSQFLRNQVWKPDLNKNQLRDSLRKHILESGFFDAGINRIVDQVVNPNVLATVFMPEVEEVVYNYLSIPKPLDKNHKRDEKVKPPGIEREAAIVKENGKFESRDENEIENGGQPMDLEEEQTPAFIKTMSSMEKYSESYIEEVNDTELKEQKIKQETEGNIKQESLLTEKVEVPSEESENSLNRMGLESLDINESEEPPLPDSDDSVPLEINEKSLSESRDSEDSIMNQMSPISQGRLTPDIEEEKKEEKEKEEKVGEKMVEKRIIVEEPKRALNFIGKIPKIKREDFESSKSSPKLTEVMKKEKLDVKNIYSSDESDSSKSHGKSDSDDKKIREKRKEEKRVKEELDKKKESEEQKKRDRSHDRSKEKKNRKEEKNRERHVSKKGTSSSSSSWERSSSGHKSSYQSRHKESRKDDERRRKDKEKRKSKSTDDHGKERKKKEDRRSTDRDSNERGCGGRSHGENKKGEKEQKEAGDGTSRDKRTGEERRGEEEPEAIPESEESAEGVVNDEDVDVLDFNDLFKKGAVIEVEFPKLTDDFYVRFNSTGFRYFQDWERQKMDCEEEFKEFVDEAEVDLSLLSDDDSDYESPNGFDFEAENRKIIQDSTKGLGNFRKSVMFDPRTFRFFKWSNNKFYQKHRKKTEDEREGKTEKNESDGSAKENIEKIRSSDGEKENRKREGKVLHLRLLNRYKRKAMRQGKHRRRHRRKDFSGGIKEKNVNSVPNKEEPDAWRLSVSEAVHTVAEREVAVSEDEEDEEDEEALLLVDPSLPVSPDENISSKWTDSQTKKNGVVDHSKTKAESPGSKENVMTCTKLSQKCDIPLNLPPSPDSDDVNTNNGVVSKENVANKKRKICEREGGQTARTQSKRNYSQKYDSQDLYKPRPVLNCSRTRERGQRLGF